MTIHLEPELESRLRDEAARQGVDADVLINQTVNVELESLVQRMGRARRFSTREAELLKQINEGLPAETWERYRQLVLKRRAETLTPDEYRELIGVSDQIDEAHGRRMGYLVDLARLRGVDLDLLMNELGLGPVDLHLDED